VAAHRLSGPARGPRRGVTGSRPEAANMVAAPAGSKRQTRAGGRAGSGPESAAYRRACSERSRRGLPWARSKEPALSEVEGARPERSRRGRQPPLLRRFRPNRTGARPALPERQVAD